MPTEKDLEYKLWKALDSDRIVMLGLDGVEDGHTRPMTAQVEQDRSPLWFFASRDMALVGKIKGAPRAIATFVSKGHDLFATLHGTLTLSEDRGAIDRLWNKHVAAWYEGGKEDPKLALLRLDAEHAEIWQRDAGVFASIKALLGENRQQAARTHAAEVPLS